MPTRITIIVNDTIIQGELADTACAKAIADALPMESRPNEWGDEFYFTIPVVAGLDETATTAVKVGDIGYWPPGKALAIFFGRTPMSTSADPVPASEVNLVGKIMGDAAVLKKVKGATKIKIEKA